MPVYEYECSKCGNLKELFQKMSDPPVGKCDQCNGKMRKLISHSSFHLKGSGWYVTDYASKSGGHDGKSSDKNSTADDSKSAKNTTTTEKKAAPASEKKTKGKD